MPPLVQRHYTFVCSTKKNKIIDLTAKLSSSLRKSRLTNGVANIYASSDNCVIVTRKSRGLGEFYSRIGSAQPPVFSNNVTVPFFSGKLVLWDQRIFLFEFDAVRNRRSVHLTLVGE
jgi:thiamine phosphate synthase YjbQ (UPF0047 family)